MATNQDRGTRAGTPRRRPRQDAATPVPEISPPTQNTRAASTALQNTPGTRRSTRATSRRPNASQDAVNSNVLPEIQTQQSYAYGSSKTPLLPEQLQRRDTMTMKQVADQMNTAITQAAQNLDAHAADLEQARNQNQTLAPPNGQATRRSSRQPSPPVSIATDVQKKQRTAAWASSLDSGQLDDVEEEPSRVETPETRRTEPSSFPSGIFDQSYQYERGLRPPRRAPSTDTGSFGSRLGAWLGAVLDRIISAFHQLQQSFVDSGRATGRWMMQISDKSSTVIRGLPYSTLFSTLAQILFFMVVMGCVSYAFCFSYSRYLCDPLSTSRVAQTLESWCGSCQSNRSQLDIPATSGIDLHKLRSALKQIDTQIRGIEARLNLRLDSKMAAVYTDIDNLRREQTKLLQQIDYMSKRDPQQSFSEVASPLIPKVNYFSPANGAIVNASFTSPTRQTPLGLRHRILTFLFGIYKYNARNPITALEPWQDVGDCWCAAASGAGQDSMRLGVGIREYIYPTELVIEYPPRDVDLTPGTAPKHVELWADFSHVYGTPQWNALDLHVLAAPSAGEARNPLGPTFALIGRAEYDLHHDAEQYGSGHHHIQRFGLDLNRFKNGGGGGGEEGLRYAARDFVVRVRDTHGAAYGCLYRVRLHGVSVGNERKQKEKQKSSMQ